MDWLPAKPDASPLIICNCSANLRPSEEIEMPYRRRNGSDTWHWCTNCNNWPTTNYDERPTKPSSGDLCNECRSKDAAGNCTK